VDIAGGAERVDGLDAKKFDGTGKILGGKEENHAPNYGIYLDG
jgi:hypothetical protein